MATSRGMSARRRRGFPEETSEDECNSVTPNHKNTLNKFGYYDSLIVWFLITVLHIGMFLFVNHRFHVFPTPMESGEGKPLHQFYEDLARGHLDTVTGFGQRTSGSYANEKLSVDYLLSKLQEFKGKTHPSKSLEIDFQNVSGSFHIYFIHTHFYNVYRNIKNVVAKVGPQSGAANSVLINCHFDSMVDSIGAGDDMASCAVMLEIARSIAQSDQPLLHNIIFLFNGAEENILQGSHGFITQHPWADSIKAFINLDSAGAGGWEIVFQTGPQHPWLIKAYTESAVYPSASVINQEIFELGIVPADTDFRIFRDFGKVPGLDIAFISNGYVYHTKLDTSEKIQPGCLQRAGENLRGLVMALATSDKLENPGDDKHGSMVFYDLLGVVIVQYPKRIGTILNCVISIVVFVIIWKKCMTITPVITSKKHEISNGFSENSSNASLTDGSGWKHIHYLGVAALVSLGAWVASVVFVIVFLALPLSFGGYSMFWYHNTYNIITVFGLSTLWSALFFHQNAKEMLFKDVEENYLEMVFFDVSLLGYAASTLILTASGLSMTYLVMLWALFPLIRVLLQKLLELNWNVSKTTLLGLHMCSLLLPWLKSVYILYLIFTLFVPIFGRSGDSINPDLAIAALTIVSVIFISQYLFGLVYLCDMRGVLRVLLVCILISILAIVFTPAGFPFSGSKTSPSPQRVVAIHTKREFYAADGTLKNSDSGIFNIALDGTIRIHNHLHKYLPEIAENRYLMTEDGPYWSMPFMLPIVHIIQNREVVYIPKNPPEVENPVNYKLITKTKMADDIMRLTFQVTGPDHINVFIRPSVGVELQGWSIVPGRPEPLTVPPALNETTYFVYYAYSETPSTPWEFYLDFKGNTQENIESRQLVDIAFCGFYIHPENKLSEVTREFIGRFPEWALPYFALTATYTSQSF